MKLLHGTMRLILINNQNQSINLLAVGEGAMLESCYSDAGKQPTSRISLLYYFLKAQGKKRRRKKGIRGLLGSM